MNSWCIAIRTIFAILICISTPGHAEDAGRNALRGPADLRNQRPYQLLFLSFSPQSAVVLPRGGISQAFQFDIGNDLLIPNPRRGAFVREDTETQRLEWKMRRGLGRGFEAGIGVPVMARNGGFLDPFISAYHSATGLLGPTRDVYTGRRAVSGQQSVIRLALTDGTTIVDAGSAYGIGDIAVYLKRGLSSGPKWATAARAGIKLPTGNAGRLLGSGGVDVGADLDLDITLTSRVVLYANISEISMQPATRLGGRAARQASRSVLALEYFDARRGSWIVQRDDGQPMVRTGNTFADGPQTTLSIAYRRAAGPNAAWTYAFTENGDLFAYKAPSLANIGPDVTLSVGWEARR